jgi:hypothetical protein
LRNISPNFRSKSLNTPALPSPRLPLPSTFLIVPLTQPGRSRRSPHRSPVSRNPSRHWAWSRPTKVFDRDSDNVSGQARWSNLGSPAYRHGPWYARKEADVIRKRDQVLPRLGVRSCTFSCMSLHGTGQRDVDLSSAATTSTMGNQQVCFERYVAASRAEYLLGAGSVIRLLHHRPFWLDE